MELVTRRGSDYDRELEYQAMLRKADARIGRDRGVTMWDCLAGRELEGERSEGLALAMSLDFKRRVMTMASTIARAAWLDLYSEVAEDEPADYVAARILVDQAWAAWEALSRWVRVWRMAKPGWDLSPTWRAVMNLAPLLRCADVVRVERIAELAGRMVTIMGEDRSRWRPGREVIDGVRERAPLDRALPAERCMLGTGGVEAEIQEVRLVTGKAAGTRHVDPEQAAVRGPLVIVLDESGSMSGDRHVWMKACFVAMVNVAHRDDREVVAVHFATGTEVTRCQPGDDEAFMRAVVHDFVGGGTDIASGLRRGRDEALRLPGADVVLVSDGLDWDHGQQESVILSMIARGVGFWTVAIGESVPVDHPVRRYASAFVHVDDQHTGSPRPAAPLAGALGRRGGGHDA